MSGSSRAARGGTSRVLDDVDRRNDASWGYNMCILSARGSVARRRAVSGEAPLGELDREERVVAHALLDASISTAANEASFAERLADRGVTTIVNGRSRSNGSPDGTTTAV